MKTILLTNDDGIDADGLATLFEVAETAFPGSEIFTVAPGGPMSQVGHRVTTDEPLRFEQRGSHSWAVFGTPADCTRVALKHLLPREPDWILSGINHGGNMGQDLVISGTVAAVREGTYHGIKGIAFSHYIKRGLTLDWPAASRRAVRAVNRVLEEDTAPSSFWSVNLPHLTPDESEADLFFCEPDLKPLPVEFVTSDEGLIYRGEYGTRERSPGSDVDVCFGGNVSISHVSLD